MPEKSIKLATSHLPNPCLITNSYLFREGEHEYWTPAEYDLLAARLGSDDETELQVEEDQLQDVGSNPDQEADQEDLDVDSDNESELEYEDRGVLADRGVKHLCPLNELQAFHSVGGFPPDILHDLLGMFTKYLLFLP